MHEVGSKDLPVLRVPVNSSNIYVLLHIMTMSSKKLTGNKRIIHDCCVDLYNSVQKWKSLTSDAHSTVLNICLIKQKEVHDQEQGEDASIGPSVSDLENLNSELELKLHNLEIVVEKMRKILKKLVSVCELSELQPSSDSNMGSEFDPILFQTWPLSRFYEAAKEIEQMYREELKTKLSLAGEICISTNKSQLTFFEACWKYEPNINRERVDELLKTMIVELQLDSQLS